MIVNDWYWLRQKILFVSCKLIVSQYGTFFDHLYQSFLQKIAVSSDYLKAILPSSTCKHKSEVIYWFRENDNCLMMIWSNRQLYYGWKYLKITYVWETHSMNHLCIVGGLENELDRRINIWENDLFYCQNRGYL